MNSQNIRLSFGDLRNLSQDEFEILPSNRILQICIDALVANKHDEQDVVNFTLRTISAQDRLREANTHYLQTFMTYLQDYVIKIVSCLDNSLDEITLNQLKNITSNLYELTSTLSSIAREIQSSSVYIILEADLRIVEQHYLFFQNSDKRESRLQERFGEVLNKLFCNCQKLQRMVIALIINNIQDFTFSSSIDCDGLNKVLHCLCYVGEFVSLVDVKSTAEIWKCISRLGTESSSYVVAEGVSIPWLQNAVEFLCNEIVQSVTIILDNLNEDDAQFLAKLERILKVNSFYLKIVVKFASDFGPQGFQGFEYVLKLSMTLNSLPESIANSKMGQNIKQYLTIGVNNLISEIYKSPKFEKALLDYEIIDAEGFQAFCTVSFEIMELIIEDGDPSVMDLYFQKKNHIIGKFLGAASLYTNACLQQNTYERLITTTAATIISASGNENVLKSFEDLLLNGILGESMMRALMSCDVMCIIFRFAKENVRRDYFKFYLKLSLALPTFSTGPKAIFINFLLRSFYAVLSSEQRGKWLEEYINEGSSDANTRVKLGLILDDCRAEKIPRLADAVTRIETELCSNVQNFLQSPSKHSYYKLANSLLLSNPKDVDSALLDQIGNIWIKLLENSNGSYHSTHVLKRCLSSFFTRKQSIPNSFLNELDCRVLRRIDQLYIIKPILISYTKDKDNEAKYCKVLNSLIECDNNLLTFMLYYSKNSQLPASLCRGALPVNPSNKENYISELGRNSFQHSCRIAPKLNKKTNNECLEIANPPKRLRLNEIQPQCSLLKDAKRIAVEISEFYKNREVNEDDWKDIKEIVNIYSQIGKFKNK